MKVSSTEMGSREKGCYGRTHKLLLLNSAYDS